jgi:hypothetical protein
VALAGCGKKPAVNQDWLPTYPAKGTVKINGVAAEGAIVRLYPVNPQPESKSPVVPTGRVQADGSFELMTYKTGDGAPEGDYVMTVEWPDPQINAAQGGMPEDPPDRLQGRFAKRDTSKLKTHISTSDNVIEIVLDQVDILKGSSVR